MPDQKKLAAIVTKAAIDQKFRNALIENPKVAAKSISLEIDDEDVKSLKKLKPEEWDSLKVKDLNERLEEIQVAALKGGSIWITTACETPPAS